MLRIRYRFCLITILNQKWILLYFYNFSSVDVIWTLLGAALVYFMQAGFAMCEAGLTRAKNTGNILMKNMMDFCIGTPAFWLV